jgi:hypothetical protein
MAEHYQHVNEPAPEPICTCLPDWPCSLHTAERETERRAAAKLGIEAWWERRLAERLAQS